MRLVSWNINSVRARLNLVADLIEKHAPDVICLQETKVEDDKFPKQAVHSLGYSHCALKGQKGHHGVAILSRLPLRDIERHNWCQVGDARYIAATLPSGYRVHNFYVPAGGDEPDPEKNPKFAHKLSFLSEMTTWAKDLQGGQILVGDLNVAPYESDVWSHKQLLKVVSHTPIECEKLLDIQKAHGFVDVMRAHIPQPEKIFSWWSYRARDWKASNRGRRLDHIWVSPDIASKATSISIDADARSWEKPSDHAPIIMDIES